MSNPLASWVVTVNPHPSVEGLEEIIVSSVKPKGEAEKEKTETETNTVFRLPTVRVHGIHHLLACNEQRWEKLNARIRYRPGDILIVSYPKCGTTWTEQAVLLLLSGGDPEQLNPRFKNSYTAANKNQLGKIWIEPMVEQEDLQVQSRMGEEASPLTWEEFDAAPSPRVIKTHAPISLLLGCNSQGLKNLPDFVKVVVVSRNPLDACVSGYFHGANPCKLGWPFEAWAALWIEGKFVFGSYFDWIAGWRAQCDMFPKRTMWIEYENMKKDQAPIIRDLADFLGVIGDDEIIDNVVRFSSFDHMKSQTENAGGDILNHLRKGTVGDWKNYFSRDLYMLFKDKFNDKLGTSGLSFPLFDE